MLTKFFVYIHCNLSTIKGETKRILINIAERKRDVTKLSVYSFLNTHNYYILKNEPVKTNIKLKLC